MQNIQIKNTEWDLSPLQSGKSFEDKRKEWENATKKFIERWKDRKNFLENPETLKQALEDYEEWCKFYRTEADEFYYYWLKTQQNQNDSELKAKFNKAEEFAKRTSNEMEFFILKISKIPEEKQKEFLESSELKEYKHFLGRLFAKSKYILSEKEEKILTLKSSSAYSLWIRMLSGFLSKEERKILDEAGEKTTKTFEGLLSSMNSKNKTVRDNAAFAFNEILKKYSEVAEVEINAILEDKKINDGLRGYCRPDKSRHISDDMDSEIVDMIVDAISKRFDISRRFYELKAKLLGQKKLEYHERNIEYGAVEKSYTYEEAINLVNEVFENLDKKFSEILQNFIENSQVDVYPMKGKRGGAFCSYSLISHPVYILLNYTGKLKDIETIAHEFGHAINDELIKTKQNSLNFGTPFSTAEVASTFMEDFVLEKLMEESDEETRLALMMQKLNADISSIMRQIACDLFQRELHLEFRKKGYLPKEEIGRLFQKHMKAYMGDFVEQSEGSENWWIHWWHIREYFYNYQYASGLLISKTLQKKVKENMQFIDKVKEFFSTGMSKSPRDIFLDLGIDISKKEFWEEGLNSVEDLLGKTERLARELKLI